MEQGRVSLQPVACIQTRGCSVNLLTYPETGQTEVTLGFGPEEALDFTTRLSVRDFLEWADMLTEAGAELRARGFVGP